VAAAVSSGSTALAGGLTPATLFETEAVAVIDQCLTVQDVANLVTDYLAPTRFGAAEWLYWFGVDVGFEPKFLREITLFWNQPGVSDTHLPPVLCPQFIDDKPFTLKLLGQLVRNPKNGGHASRYALLSSNRHGGDPFTNTIQSSALNQHQDTPAGPACWLILKNGIEARNQPYAEQVAWLQRLPGNYEARTSALHLATVVFTRHVITGERHLGKGDSQERHPASARCQELVHNGASTSLRLTIGSFSYVGLLVDASRFPYDHSGVVALRKF